MQKSLILLFTLFTLFSCSSDQELTFEEKFEGSWTGVITQPEYASFKIDVTINKLVSGSNTASGNYSESDFGICNNDLYFCDDAMANPSECDFRWAFTLSNGSSVTFEETPLDLNACAPGVITLRIINDDMISYRWVDNEAETNIATGSMSRK